MRDDRCPNCWSLDTEIINNRTINIDIDDTADINAHLCLVCDYEWDT